MAKSVKKGGISKRNKWIIGIVAVFVFLVAFVLIFGTPSAESVFKDMNEAMLKTKYVTVDQEMTMNASDGSTSNIKISLYMDMESRDELLAKGDFSLSIANSATPMSVSGDLIKIGENSYVKFSDISSTDPTISSSFSTYDSKLNGKWVKVREGDQFASFASTPLEFTSSILPTPYANLDSSQIKDVLAILQDKDMYTIDESAKVETSGVSAYKYSITYDKDQYNKLEKSISGYVDYFKAGDDNKSEIKSLTVWVNISTKQIIKIEFEGTSSDGNVTGTIEFSDYNKKKSVEKPSDYFVESELLN